MKNSKLFEKAKKFIPGGVNSPVRAFGAVGGNPPFILKGKGAFIFDINNKKYLDFCCSWGPLILGHARKEVVQAVAKIAKRGLSFGACTPLELEMAELINSLVPDIEMLRLVNSGTEAVMTAIRLARAVSGREKIVKFDGAYHGHSDSLLISAGSGLATTAISSSAGVTKGSIEDTIILPYNSVSELEKIFNQYGNQIAAVIVEPVAGNMGLVMPKKSFLQTIRKLCKNYNAVLIFDEVITGFRFHRGTYSQICGVKPDLFVLGKIIGGGMPVGAVGGSRKIMKNLSPAGMVYQAGTLSGNPVAVSAGITTLKILKEENPYPHIAKLSRMICSHLAQYEKKYPIKIASTTGMFTIFFTDLNKLPENFEEVKKSSVANFAKFHNLMIENSIYMPPSQFETAFISAAHSEKNISYFCEKITNIIKKIF
ncbi:MAG TPA: glutamate-1-semialdehyde 2,1-aminomutase [Victivallales bacterium]|nr:glutamate-1-semialdehyde 2,1-aminomutase [Victivallales bacterium]HPO89585.1 glutamate-1-semialdehyde 2,1-aminomutase [Victivallales bacterium]HRR28418.1 glutamate-1-semialdehyde 2,1-aminomutase [Victivallales bacterium]HRU00252.1 glutamate-1-semialdehyde 2,1-aminomutase [Victivallales bacterium]